VFLRELFFKPTTALTEGGNLSSDSPGWAGDPGHQADEINLEVHNRSHMINIFSKLLHDIDQSFKSYTKTPLWSPELLSSRQFLGGSSLHFFNTSGITDQEFAQHKPKVGDIDTQVDKKLEAQVQAFLSAYTNKKIGDSTLLGFSQGNEQYNALFQFQDPPVKLQIDFEFGQYDEATGTPDEWFKFSHSSDWNDITHGIKGVFHKYLYRSLSGLSVKEFYVAKLAGRGNARAIQVADTPITDSTVSFAVASSQGGGVSEKYKPYIDPTTGQPMVKNGLPVMEPVAPANRTYIQNLAQQFQLLFGQAPSAEDSKLQQSFIGTLDLINKYVEPSLKPDIVDKFLSICFEVGSQMITKDDPARDAQTKFAAIDVMLEKLDLGTMRQRAVEMAQTYEDDFNEVEAYKKANPNERQPRAALKKAKAAQGLAESDATVVQSKRKGIVHLEKMKDIDFINLLDDLKDKASGKITLDNITMNVKVDGFGGRLGMDENGRPYAETSRSGPKFEPGQFTAFAKAKGADPESLKVSAKWDQWWDQMIEVTNAVAEKIDLKNTKVHVEVLYLPFAEEQDDGRLKFVGIHYDKFPEDVNMALVPLFAEVSSTGQPHPQSDQIVATFKSLNQVGTTMIIDNRLSTKNSIDATAVLPPMENIEALRVQLLSGKRDQKREAAEAIQPIKDQLGQFIINHPDIVGKDILGKDFEGIVLNTPSGPVKITSPEQKQVIADKNAAIAAAGQARKTAGSAVRTSTAVVTAGSFVGHKGHEQLVNLALNKAKEFNGDTFVYISPSVGPDDPIPPDVKLETWRRLYPQHADMFQVWQEGGTPVKKIEKELVLPPDSPYKHIILMVGTDRYAGFKKWMDTLSKRMKDPRYPGSHNDVTFDTIETKREAEHGGTGISFTQCRQVLQDATKTPEQQLHVWLQAFDEKRLGRDWIEHLMNIARTNMGIPAPKQEPQDNTAHTKHSAIKEANAVIRKWKAKRLAEQFSTDEFHNSSSNGYGSSKNVLSPEMQAAMPGAMGIKGMPNPFYDLYRLGVAIAGGDRNESGDAHIGQDPMIIPYTKIEHQNAEKHAKKLGFKPKMISTPGSDEPKHITSVSPVNKPKKNKYGI
jgi:hypothetical protein